MVSSLGWVDHGSLWTFRVAEHREGSVPLGSAEYLSLYAGTGDHFLQFDWYNTDYDKDYQGIVGVAEVPGGSQALVAVQRDSRLVLYDPVTETRRQLIGLAGRCVSLHDRSPAMSWFSIRRT